MDRLWNRTDRSSECWVWTGYVDRYGYGKISFHGRIVGAHRVAYMLTKGDIPVDMQVDHICWETLCINPDHLRLLPFIESVTRQRSMLRTHCSHGHEMTSTNTYVKPGRPNTRTCRACNRDRVAEYTSRKKAATS